ACRPSSGSRIPSTWSLSWSPTKIAVATGKTRATTGSAGVDRAKRDHHRACDLFLFRWCEGGRSFANNQQHGFLILGAVVVHLSGEMGNEGAGRHGNRTGGIELAPGPDPPGSLDNGNEAVVGVKMRAAHVARQPLR